MYLTGVTSLSVATFVISPGYTDVFSSDRVCLITMRRITPPITATQSDFHDPMGAACSQLSRNYSPCLYRKPSSEAQPFDSHNDRLADMHTHELTHWPGGRFGTSTLYVQNSIYVCIYVQMKCFKRAFDCTPNWNYNAQTFWALKCLLASMQKHPGCV